MVGLFVFIKNEAPKGGFRVERVGFEPTVHFHAQQIFNLSQ